MAVAEVVPVVEAHPSLTVMVVRAVAAAVPRSFPFRLPFSGLLNPSALAPVAPVVQPLPLTIRMAITVRMEGLLHSGVLPSLLAAKAVPVARPQLAPHMPVVTVRPSAATAVDPIWPQPEEIPNKPRQAEAKVRTSMIPTPLSLEATVATPVSVLVTAS